MTRLAQNAWAHRANTWTHRANAYILLYLVMGSRAARPLDELKVWMVDNNAAIMSVLLLVRRAGEPRFVALPVDKA